MIVRLADTKMSFGLSHGDLASGNVLVRPDGALVLIDWGAATCGPVPYTDLLILEHNHASDDDPSIKDLAAYAVGYGLDLGRVGPNFDAIRKADRAGPGQMGFGPTTRPAYGVCGVGPPGTHSTNQHLTGSRPRCGYFLMFFQTWAKVVRSRLERFVRPYTSASVIEAIAIAKRCVRPASPAASDRHCDWGHHDHRRSVRSHLGTVGRSFGNSEPSTLRDLALPDVATLEQLVERVVEAGDHQSGATW